MFKKSIGTLSFALVVAFATTAFAQSIKEKKDPCDYVDVSPEPGSTITLYANFPLVITTLFYWDNFPIVEADISVETPLGPSPFCNGSYSVFNVSNSYSCFTPSSYSPNGYYEINVEISPWKTCTYGFYVNRLHSTVKPVR